MSKLLDILKLVPWLMILASLSLIYGFLVPTIFELGEGDSVSTRHDWPQRISIGVAALTMIAVVAVVIYRRKHIEIRDKFDRLQSLQFGIRELLIAMTVTAVLMVAFPLFEAEMLSGLVAVVALVLSVGSFYFGRPAGLRMLALVAVMFLPFVWMIVYNKPFGNTSGLAENIPIGPGVLPSQLLVSSIEQFGRPVVEVFAAIFVLIELAIGALLAKRGGKIATTYIVLIMLLSFLSSLALHVLYRM